MNAVDSTAQPTSERITSGDVQPSVGARVSAKTKQDEARGDGVRTPRVEVARQAWCLALAHEAAHEEQRADARSAR